MNISQTQVSLFSWPSEKHGLVQGQERPQKKGAFEESADMYLVESSTQEAESAEAALDVCVQSQIKLSQIRDEQKWFHVERNGYAASLATLNFVSLTEEGFEDIARSVNGTKETPRAEVEARLNSVLRRIDQKLFRCTHEARRLRNILMHSLTSISVIPSSSSQGGVPLTREEKIMQKFRAIEGAMSALESRKTLLTSSLSSLKWSEISSSECERIQAVCHLRQNSSREEMMKEIEETQQPALESLLQFVRSLRGRVS